MVDHQVYLQVDDFIDKTYVLAFGISQIKGYSQTKFYTQVGSSQISFKLTYDNAPTGDTPTKTSPTTSSPVKTPDSKTKTQCRLEVLEDDHVWSGVPIFLKVETIDSELLVNVSKWLGSYMYPLIKSAYAIFDQEIEPDRKANGSDGTNGTNGTEGPSGSKPTSVHYYDIKKIKSGLQITGGAKVGNANEDSPWSVDFVINMYQLPEVPMVGRVGDVRVGYFYDNIHIDTTSKLTGNPVVLINRLDLKKQPWVYVVDKTIPKEFHQLVKKGILSWNKYFKYLGLGEPFKVKCLDDPDYPEGGIDVFDAEAFYVVGTTADEFNGPYSGFCQNVTDYRSGEILFGLVSLNLIKMTSNPIRYGVMSGIEPHLRRVFAKYVDQYVAWITAHEVGHQLGLRHNFMGVFKQGGVSTVMDYIDLFTDLTNMNIYNPWGTIREYDLHVIEYGYKPLDNEVTGHKHPQLAEIADRIETPFGTDENLYEGINPLVEGIRNVANPLTHVEDMIPLFRTYRQNLVAFAKAGKITPFEYNNMFIYLYTQKYVELIDLCLRYVGGRYYDQKRSLFIPIEMEAVNRSVTLLLQLLDECEYTEEEYQYFVYDFVYDKNRQLYNRVEQDSIYSMNVKNLYFFYQEIVNYTLRNLTAGSRYVRLEQNHVGAFATVDLLYNFTFAFRTLDASASKGKNESPYAITTVDGIFPEIGAINANAGRWQDMLLTRVSPLRYNRQYSWVDQLLRTYHKSKFNLTKESIYMVLETLMNTIHDEILPYLQTLQKKKISGTFWKDPHVKAYSHWKMLYELLSKPVTLKGT